MIAQARRASLASISKSGYPNGFWWRPRAKGNFMSSGVPRHDSLIRKIRRQPLVRKIWSDRRLHLLVTDATCSAPATTLEIGINNFQHLSRFEQTTSWLTRDVFLSLSRRHCERRDCYIFTVADAHGPLLGYGMAEANAIQSRYTEVDQRVRWPKGTATLFSDFVHPEARGRGIHSVLQAARINFLIREAGMRWIVSAVEADNLSAMRSARKTSFRFAATLETRFRLGFHLCAVSVIDPTFDAQFLDDPRYEVNDSYS